MKVTFHPRHFYLECITHKSMEIFSTAPAIACSQVLHWTHNLSFFLRWIVVLDQMSVRFCQLFPLLFCFKDQQGTQRTSYNVGIQCMGQLASWDAHPLVSDTSSPTWRRGDVVITHYGGIGCLTAMASRVRYLHPLNSLDLWVTVLAAQWLSLEGATSVHCMQRIKFRGWRSLLVVILNLVMSPGTFLPLCCESATLLNRI